MAGGGAGGGGDSSSASAVARVTPAEAAARLTTMRIAFVDDEKANCRLGMRMLGILGVPRDHVTVLVDGTSRGSPVLAWSLYAFRLLLTHGGVRLWRRSGMEASEFMAAGTPVDVMLLDVRMPGKSGLDAVCEQATRPRYPIIAMTGHVDIEALDDFQYVWEAALGRLFCLCLCTVIVLHVG